VCLKSFVNRRQSGPSDVFSEHSPQGICGKLPPWSPRLALVNGQRDAIVSRVFQQNIIHNLLNPFEVLCSMAELHRTNGLSCDVCPSASARRCAVSSAADAVLQPFGGSCDRVSSSSPSVNSHHSRLARTSASNTTSFCHPLWSSVSVCIKAAAAASIGNRVPGRHPATVWSTANSGCLFSYTTSFSSSSTTVVIIISGVRLLLRINAAAIRHHRHIRRRQSRHCTLIHRTRRPRRWQQQLQRQRRQPERTYVFEQDLTNG
jgi:hypothetical protein